MELHETNRNCEPRFGEHSACSTTPSPCHKTENRWLLSSHPPWFHKSSLHFVSPSLSLLPGSMKRLLTHSPYFPMNRLPPFCVFLALVMHKCCLYLANILRNPLTLVAVSFPSCTLKEIPLTYIMQELLMKM